MCMMTKIKKNDTEQNGLKRIPDFIVIEKWPGSMNNRTNNYVTLKHVIQNSLNPLIDTISINAMIKLHFFAIAEPRIDNVKNTNNNLPAGLERRGDNVS